MSKEPIVANQKRSLKERRIRERIENARKAYEQYASGILSEYEKMFGSDPVRLAAIWKGALQQAEHDLKNLLDLKKGKEK